MQTTDINSHFRFMNCHVRSDAGCGGTAREPFGHILHELAVVQVNMKLNLRLTQRHTTLQQIGLHSRSLR